MTSWPGSWPRRSTPWRGDEAGGVVAATDVVGGRRHGAAMNRRGQWAVGQAILNWSWFGTAVFTFTAVSATVWPERFEWLNSVVSLVLFAAGAVVMVWALLIAVERSRRHVIGIAGLYFAVGSAGPQVQRILLNSVAVEIVVALTTASIRSYTPAAFGLLVPIWALGLTGLWCARYGEFEVRKTDPQSG